MIIFAEAQATWFTWASVISTYALYILLLHLYRMGSIANEWMNRGYDMKNLDKREKLNFYAEVGFSVMIWSILLFPVYFVVYCLLFLV